MPGTFHFRIQGRENAPWITFVPGIGNDETFWSREAGRLATDFRILTFDPWGHGKSPPPPAAGFARYIAAIGEMWDELGINRTTVIGHGFGGSVTLAAAIAFPDRVTRAIACCCRARQPDDRRAFWRERRTKAEDIGMAALAETTVNTWLSAAYREANPDITAHLKTVFRSTSLEGYQAYVDMFIEMDFDSRLGEITAPTLLIAAEHDKGGGPVADMREMASRIPSARLAALDGVGHIAPVEAPEALGVAIDGFLSTTSDV